MRVFLGALLVAAAFGQTWQVQKPNLGTILMGISFVSPAEGFLAGDDNGIGPIILKTTDGGNNYQTLNYTGYTMIFMSVAFSSATNGVAAGIGFGKELHGIDYTVDGETFNWTAGNELVDISQSVEAMKGMEGGFGVTGTFLLTNGVAVSTDKGVTWKNFNCSADTLARYGSFPSNTTWYVTAGTWPGENDTSTETGVKQLTQRLRYRQGKGIELALPEHGSVQGHDRKLLQADNGYLAEVSMTTDAGKTWSTVYKDAGNFYLNAIDCFDTQNCWAVGESDADSNNPGVRIIHTADGGKTWEVQLFINDSDYSMMDVSFITATEGWVAGGILTPTKFTGEFWHTSDAGKTWVASNVSGVYGTALSFTWVNQTAGQYVGWATALTREGQSSVLMYK